MSSNRTSDEWVAQYSRSHQHPVNQFCHMIGIPVIVGALVLAAVGAWRLALAAFVVGWIFQFVGHAFEGKPPEFFRNWRFLLVGLRWWVAKIRGRSQASRLASMRPDPEARFGGTQELDLNTIKLVSWDVDGTLYSVARMRSWLLGLMLRELLVGRGAGIGHDLEALRRHRAAVGAARSRGGILAEGLSAPERQMLLTAERRWYGSAIARTGSRPGVSELLDWFAAKQIPQIVISDYEADYKLDALRLRAYFTATYCGDALGFVKPSPRLFERAVADFNIEPRELLHIGDRSDTDEVAALAAGCQCLVLGHNFRNFRAFLDGFRTGGLGLRRFSL